MTTVTKDTKRARNTLITDAMEVLLKHLGPEKTVRFWHALAPKTEDYLTIRSRFFAHKDDETLDPQIRKFNRK